MTTMTLDEALAEAIGHHRAGRLAEAERLYTAVLNARPDHPVANHNLGEIALRVGRPDVAAVLVERALKADPDAAAYLNTLGEALRLTGRHTEALATFDRLIAAQPQNGPAHENRGIVLSAIGRRAEAIEALGHAVTLQPGRAKAWTNLGNVQLLAGRSGEAEVVFRSALKLDPADIDAAFGLARALTDLGRMDEAAEAASVLDFTGSHAPKLAGLLTQCGRPDRARSVLERQLAHDPADASGCAAILAGLGMAETPPHAPGAQMQKLYAERAQYWDAGSAEYMAHEAVGRAVAERVSDAVILDAGCGTGLCGDLLRPVAQRLEGVDLSAPMLAKARARGLYDELHHAELVAFLQSKAGAYDAIACAATLIHFGDLRAPLSAARHALRSRGLIVATLFPADDGFGVHPEPHMAQGGIFAHSEAYVREVASETGFSVEVLERIVHEHRDGEPVTGLLVVLRSGPARGAPGTPAAADS